MNTNNKIKFKYVNKTTGEMADTPMACDRQTATIYINPILYSKLTPFERKFWTWHEKGHIILNTPDEFQADKFAFNKLAGTEFRSLKQMLTALETLLDKNNYFHQERIENIYRLALEWDKKHPEINKSISGENMNHAITTITQSYNNMMKAMGQMMILNKTTTEQNLTKKDNTLMVVGLAVGAMFIFSTFMSK